MHLRIGLDLDDTIAGFWNQYLIKFGQPSRDEEITRNVMRKLRYDKEFWEGLPIVNRPNFQVALYCTSRVSKKQWTKNFLDKNLFPKAPIYQRWGYGLSKAPLIKGRVDVFIDDSPFNFMDLNKNGIPCLLIDTPLNRDFDTQYRIHSLDLDEIITIYNNLLRDDGH